MFGFFAFFGIRVVLPLFEALPLCGAAVTFFAAAKKVTKESGLHRRRFERTHPANGV